MALLFFQVPATQKNTFYLPVSADNATVKRTGTELLLNKKTQCQCPTDVGRSHDNPCPTRD